MSIDVEQPSVEVSSVPKRSLKLSRGSRLNKCTFWSSEVWSRVPPLQYQHTRNEWSIDYVGFSVRIKQISFERYLSGEKV